MNRRHRTQKDNDGKDPDLAQKYNVKQRSFGIGIKDKVEVHCFQLDRGAEDFFLPGNTDEVSMEALYRLRFKT